MHVHTLERWHKDHDFFDAESAAGRQRRVLWVVALTAVAPPEIIGIAYDSGGVTTSTITVPLVTALGVGLATVIRGRNPAIDGFGLIAFASLTPMAFVLVFGIVTGGG